MPLLTDATIQAAIQKVKKGRKASINLTDPAPRGSGRLVLIAKPGRAEWYAQRFVEGRRKFQKLGAYPAMSLAEARERHAGHKPSAGRNTLGDLLDAYLLTLAGRPAHKQAKSVFKRAASVIGRGRLARDITPGDIVAMVKPTHASGKIHMAEKQRMFMHAAFAWALHSTFDYRTESPRDWGLSHNPVSALPVDERAYNARDVWLDVDRFLRLLVWASRGRPGSARHAIAVIMLTGQRVSEVCRVATADWDSRERTLHWAKTKNGKPHTVPVCAQAAHLLDAIKTDRPHLYAGNHPRPHMGVDAIRAALGKSGMDGFTARDLRRTFKTLAGMAGLTKVDRDLIQNHGQTGNVSAKHYDRYEAMAEKRAAIAQWEAWLQKVMGEQGAQGCAQQVVQPKQDGGGQHVDAI